MMKRIAGVVAVFLSVAFLAAWFAWAHHEGEMPSIPASLAPINGAITEYWPNQELRSERFYRDGQVREAAYYSSDGSVVFEMSSDDAE